MSSAKRIIKKFGGQTALASLIGKGQSTVAYWAKTGSIPARWQPKLLVLAIENGVKLSAQDFVAGVEVEQNNQIAGFDVELMSTESDKTTEINSFDSDVGISPFLFYSSTDGAVRVQVLVENETVWASQAGMSEIFDTDQSGIARHLANIFDSNELDEACNMQKMHIANSSKPVKFYSLDAIISVGYRVNSIRATQFRRWATSVLKAYLIKGYVLDDDRLKQGNQLFGKDYFDELLEKIREIRASERRFNQKITDIYAQCSIDYDKDSPITHKFYAHVQDKLHYAVHGHTSAELLLRADASQPHMGLKSYKNEAKGGKVTKPDITVGKNYLDQEELSDMNRLVSMYLDFAENFARRQKLLTMKDWAERLDGFLEFNAYDVLNNFGNVKRKAAERHAIGEYEKFRVIQDREYKSDFDKVVDEIKVNKKLPN